MISSELIKKVPHSIGVYLFRDASKKIIYIGKSIDLRNRVKQYFVKSGDPRMQVILIRRNTVSIDYHVTQTEQEALLLEYNLIRRYQPRYNVSLKETNKYPYIMITNDDLPRIQSTWKKDEKGIYFGPFTSSYFVSNMVDIISDIFMLRKCRNKNPRKACIEKQMGRCNAPCEYASERIKYKENIEHIKKILGGHYRSMLELLNEKMREESEREHFENAAKIRDTVKIIRNYIRRGKKTGVRHRNRDMIYAAREGTRGIFTIVRMRDGVITDILDKKFTIPVSIPDEMVLKDAVLDHYSMADYSDMSLLLLPYDVEENDIENLFNGRVKVRVQSNRGIDKRLFETAKENAERKLADYMQKEYIPPRLKDLQSQLMLDRIPQLIGGVDISHFSGKWSAGAVICFKNGKPFKSAYRYYKLEYIGNDDYQSITHILGRYLDKYKLDMVLIDGGIGQLGAAKKVIDKMTDKPFLFSLSKRPDTLYNKDGKAISINPKSSAMKLIRDIRDESHRFANKLRKIQMEKLND